MKDSIIFDLDGTLWDATRGIHIGWNKALKKAGHDFIVSHELVKSTMGLGVDDMAAKAFPHIEDLNERREVLYQCFAGEEETLAEVGGDLMDGLEDVLTELKKDYKLYIVSNCQDGYIQVFLKAHNMHEYFDGFICAGDSGMSKGQNNLKLIREEGLKAAVYVGDTRGDHESAIEAGIPFVFCTFGFGETENPDYVVDSLRELPELMKKM